MTMYDTEVAKANVWSRLYHGETRIDFMRHRRAWFFVSLAVIGLSLVGTAAQGGLNLGIDFRGGTSWEIPADATVPDVEKVMAELGQGGAGSSASRPPPAPPTYGSPPGSRGRQPR